MPAEIYIEHHPALKMHDPIWLTPCTSSIFSFIIWPWIRLAPDHLPFNSGTLMMWPCVDSQPFEDLFQSSVPAGPLSVFSASRTFLVFSVNSSSTISPINHNLIKRSNGNIWGNKCYWWLLLVTDESARSYVHVSSKWEFASRTFILFYSLSLSLSLSPFFRVSDHYRVQLFLRSQSWRPIF
jgi:hypothetical protein